MPGCDLPGEGRGAQLSPRPPLLAQAEVEDDSSGLPIDLAGSRGVEQELPLTELLQPSSPYLSIESFTSPITGQSFNAQVLARTPRSAAMTTTAARTP